MQTKTLEENNLKDSKEEVEFLLTERYPGILLDETHPHNKFRILDRDNNLEIDMCLGYPYTPDQGAWMPRIFTPKGRIFFITEGNDKYLHKFINPNCVDINPEEGITENDLFDSLFLAKAVSEMLLYFDSLPNDVKKNLPNGIKYRNIARQNLDDYQKLSLTLILDTIDRILEE